MAKAKTGWQQLSVSALRLADWNYKKDEPDKLAKLVENLRQNGQVENIIVRELEGGAFEVVNGNHRLHAFLTLGWDKVQVYNLGAVSDAHARKIAIETNETKFAVDHVQLAGIIAQLADEGFTVEQLEQTFPWQGEEMQSMIDALSYDWSDRLERDKPTASESDGEAQQPAQKTCPNCGHVLEG